MPSQRRGVTIDEELARQFVQLTKRQRQLESELNGVKEEIKPIHERMLKEFEKGAHTRRCR